MDWMAQTPETAYIRLNAGAGAAPMEAASVGYTAMGARLGTLAAELTGLLSTVGAAWQSEAGMQLQKAGRDYVTWCESTAVQCGTVAGQAQAQAASYLATAAAIPQMPELVQNHVTHATLQATNFLGVNTVPIGVNEGQYTEMWGRAAALMSAFFAQTVANTTFVPFLPSPPIFLTPVSPGLTPNPTAVPRIAEAVARNLLLAINTARSEFGTMMGIVGQATSTAGTAASIAQMEARMDGVVAAGRGSETAKAAEYDARAVGRIGIDQVGETPGQDTQQGSPQEQIAQQGSGLVSQGSSLVQAPLSAGQGFIQLPQQLAQPAQGVMQPVTQAASKLFEGKFGDNSNGSLDHNLGGGFFGTSPISPTLGLLTGARGFGDYGAVPAGSLGTISGSSTFAGNGSYAMPNGWSGPSSGKPSTPTVGDVVVPSTASPAGVGPMGAAGARPAEESRSGPRADTGVTIVPSAAPASLPGSEVQEVFEAIPAVATATNSDDSGGSENNDDDDNRNFDGLFV